MLFSQNGSFGLVGSKCIPERDVSWFDGLICMPLLSSLETRGQDNWWLIDSGASVTVFVGICIEKWFISNYFRRNCERWSTVFCSEWD